LVNVNINDIIQRYKKYRSLLSLYWFLEII
jgi:hypothetical protein